MSIDRGKLKENFGKVKICFCWLIDNHEIILIAKKEQNEDYFTQHLVCECDLNDREDLDICPKKETVINGIKARKKKENRAKWRASGLEEAILDIFTRVNNGEYFGQSVAGVIYVQEVAELVGKSVRKVQLACEKLFIADKLDLYGAILIPYRARFRFPHELRNLLAYIIEEPLGWPNGEAGEGFVQELERAITVKTSFDHGRKAFGSENFPRLAPRHLLLFGLSWIQLALEAAKIRGGVKEDLRTACNLRVIARHLEHLARQCEALNK